MEGIFNALDAIPALVRMTVVFVIVLAGIRRRLSLGNAFMLGALAMALSFGMQPRSMARSVWTSATDPKTLSLAAIVALILVLSNSMEKAGQMQRLLGHFKGLITNPRLNLILFPALIGLLPMPGGAVFSAPMVKTLGEKSDLSDSTLSFTNYWFRHIWEYWWPMYPGVLLATLMADIQLSIFVGIMFPLTLVALFLGGRPLRYLKTTPSDEKSTGLSKLLPFLRELLPILLVIVPGLGLGLLFSAWLPESPVAKEAGLILALCGAIGWVWRANRFTAERILSLLSDPQLLKMIYMVLAILVFKGILNDGHAVEKISRELMRLHIPLVCIAALLPFIVGLFTGITIAFVGSTFPILISLIQTMAASSSLLPYIMLGMTAGFMGVLLSPLHLCLLLSNEYFATPAAPVYRLLWRPCLGLLVAGIGYFYLLRTITLDVQVF